MPLTTLDSLASVRMYLNRVGADPRGLKTAVVKVENGDYWDDVATIRFGRDGMVRGVAEAYAPTPDEQKAICTEWASQEFPTLKRLPARWRHRLPEELSRTADRDLFVFHDAEGGRPLMLQQRIERKRGKAYISWTWWSDGRWRRAEPDVLPLYGMETIGENETVFVHEGAKAARACREPPDGHPWGAELSGAAHVGWIGGAQNPLRTNWRALARAGVKNVYIVADNDLPGKDAVRLISRALKLPCHLVQFNRLWPPGFDLADPFPQAMFHIDDGEQEFYRGPAFQDCVFPVTWATEPVEKRKGEKGRKAYRLTRSFRNAWAYVEDTRVFVCRTKPGRVRTKSELNDLLMAYSDVDNTVRLLLKQRSEVSMGIAYRPDLGPGEVYSHGKPCINTYVPPSVRPVPGDPSPWLEFMEYLIPDEHERHQVFRWCATLIAKPEVRILYALLLISEMQGVGKTTLGEAVLCRLVGRHNVSFPNESSVESDFNDWIAHKRLAIVSEIYTGRSKKVYNRLKNVVTDETVEINRKFMKAYETDNHCHIFASSNTHKALYMDEKDRRWFYPRVTEEKWPRERFAVFRSWLDGPGLGIVLSWAMEFGDYVLEGEEAPMSRLKEEIIEESVSEAIAEARRLAWMTAKDERPLMISSRRLIEWAGRRARDRESGYLKPSDYLRALRHTPGMTVLSGRDGRVHLEGQWQWVLMNAACVRELNEAVGGGGKVARDRWIRTRAAGLWMECLGLIDGEREL